MLPLVVHQNELTYRRAPSRLLPAGRARVRASLLLLATAAAAAAPTA